MFLFNLFFFLTEKEKIVNKPDIKVTFTGLNYCFFLLHFKENSISLGIYTLFAMRCRQICKTSSTFAYYRKIASISVEQPILTANYLRSIYIKKKKTIFSSISYCD